MSSANNSSGIVPLAEIKLKDPIHEGSEVHTKIAIKRKPTLGDMDGITLSREMTSSDISLLLGRISTLPTPLIKKMTLIDVAEVMEVIQPFLPSAGNGG